MPTEAATAARVLNLKDRVLLNALVDKETGCWEWQGYRDRHGYGTLSVNGKPKLAHRCSWEVHFGRITDGLLVCHRCDNRRCINPAHLFLGTADDNAKDMVGKQRQVILVGEASSQAKLTDAVVRDIRRQVAAGRPQRQLAIELGVGPMTINKIVHRKTWRHIDG